MFKKINCHYCFSPVTHLSKLAVSGRSMTAPHWLRSGVNSNQERRVPMTTVLSVCLSQSILNSIWRKQDMENPTTTPFSKLHLTLHNTSHLYKNIILCLNCASPVLPAEWIECWPAILTLNNLNVWNVNFRESLQILSFLQNALNKLQHCQILGFYLLP